MRQIGLLLLITQFVVLDGMAQDLATLPQRALQAHLGGAAPSDITVIGTLTDASGAQPFRMQVKGKNQMRYETGTGASMKVTIFNGEAAWAKAGNRFQRLETHTAVRRPAILPFLDLMGEFGSAGLQTTYSGLETVSGRNVHHFRFRLPDPRPQGRPFNQRLDEQADIYIDTATSLVLRSERVRWAENDIYFRSPSVLEFSDYRRVGRLMIPFQIVNTLGTAASGLRRSTLTVQSVLIDQALQDSIFLPN